MSSDVEMASPPASKKSNRSPQKKKKEPSPVEDDEEENASEGKEEEEEYEIEKILEAKKGVFNPGKWAFLVKWKNYDETENSWVNEVDFFAKDMIERFWEDNPDVKGNPRKPKSTVKGRKSEVSASGIAKSSSKASLKGSKSKNEDPSEEDSVSTKPVKRKPAKDESEEIEGTPEVDGDEDEPPKKKSKTAPVKKKPAPAVDQKNGFFQTDDDDDDAEEPVTHDENAMDKHMHKKNWETLISTIETVERADKDTLMVYFTTTHGTRAICNSHILAQKAPQKLIEFYEGHLRWRGASPVASQE